MTLIGRSPATPGRHGERAHHGHSLPCLAALAALLLPLAHTREAGAQDASVVDWVRPSLLAFREEDEARPVAMTVQFMCPACGGASIAVPATCAEEAEIACGSCGNVLGTWGEFKERARSLIRSRGAGDEGGSKVVSLDPLPR